MKSFLLLTISLTLAIGGVVLLKIFASEWAITNRNALSAMFGALILLPWLLAFLARYCYDEGK